MLGHPLEGGKPSSRLKTRSGHHVPGIIVQEGKSYSSVCEMVCVPRSSSMAVYIVLELLRSRVFLSLDSLETLCLVIFQDNYTFAQPGIQHKINQLRELVKRIDGKNEIIMK